MHMQPEDEFTLHEKGGKARVDELRAIYRREFDIPFANEFGAKHTRGGFPCSMNDAPSYYPSKWSHKTIDEDAMRQVKKLFDKELSAKAPADRRNPGVRKCIAERLWTCAYDKAAREERRAEAARIAELNRRADEREFRLLVARAKRKAEDEEREEAEMAAQTAAAQAAAEAVPRAHKRRRLRLRRRSVAAGGPGMH